MRATFTACPTRSGKTDDDLVFGKAQKVETPLDGSLYPPEPETEFQETVNKSKAGLKAVALAEIFGKSP